MKKPTSDIPVLPMEVWTEILLRIPAEDVVKFMVVCKAWHDLINSQSFARSHADHWTSRPMTCGLLLDTIESHKTDKYIGGGIYYLPDVKGEGSTRQLFRRFRLNDDNYSWECHKDHEGVERIMSKGHQVLASCHGLILVCYQERLHNNYRLLVCNPFTGSYRRLPEFRRMDIREFAYLDVSEHFVWTMSRTASIGQYKIFVIRKRPSSARTWRCYVFELQGSGKGQPGCMWKELQIPLSEGWRIEASTIKDGKVHWLAGRLDEFKLSYCETKVLSIDILKEEFSVSVSAKFFLERGLYFHALDGAFYSHTTYDPKDELFVLYALQDFHTMTWSEYRNIHRGSTPSLGGIMHALDMQCRYYFWPGFDPKLRYVAVWGTRKVLPHTNSLVRC